MNNTSWQSAMSSLLKKSKLLPRARIASNIYWQWKHFVIWFEILSAGHLALVHHVIINIYQLHTFSYNFHIHIHSQLLIQTSQILTHWGWRFNTLDWEIMRSMTITYFRMFVVVCRTHSLWFGELDSRMLKMVLEQNEGEEHGCHNVFKFNI